MEQIQHSLTLINDIENNIVIEDDNPVLEFGLKTTTCDFFASGPEPFYISEDTSFVDLENGLYDFDPYLVEPSIIKNVQVIIPSSNYNSKNLTNQEVHEIMTDIEQAVTFSSVREGLQALNISNILTDRIQNTSDTFKEKTGRNMTYSEMRYMMG